MANFLRPKDVKGTTVLDRILKAFLKGDLDKLSPDDKQVLERISEVDNRLRKGYIVTEPRVSVLTGAAYDFKYSRPYRKSELAQWQVSRFQVSLSQAYADIQMAEKFFLTTESRADKEFGRGMMIHWGEDVAAKAQADGDYRAFAAIYRELAKIRQLDRPDDQNFKPEDFHPIRPIIVSDPSELDQPFPKTDNPDALVARLLKEMKKGVIEKILDDAEDVEEEDGE
ncbi:MULTISPECIES: hypothetical protein [Sphingobacterium]|uniref:Uncharacterized protein n=1 Tax=Sphingobacterium populi TaxID=1812824 RepID=A0ABW5U9I1_9SPHI|nr:hypothetical protein [Sphingobacterium sp. CFCC 11742]